VKRTGIPPPSPGAATDTPGAATDTPGAATVTPGAATDTNANYLPQMEEWQEVEVVLQHQGKDFIYVDFSYHNYSGPCYLYAPVHNGL
jgi:hypothetical protein